MAITIIVPNSAVLIPTASSAGKNPRLRKAKTADGCKLIPESTPVTLRNGDVSETIRFELQREDQTPDSTADDGY